MATGLRDQIYGVAGQFEEQDTLNQPDYSLTTCNVYTRCYEYLLNKCGSVSFLYEVGVPREIDDLPFWVPDWSTKKHCDISIGNVQQVAFIAGGTSKSIRVERKNLIASGDIIDEISTLLQIPSVMQARDWFFESMHLASQVETLLRDESVHEIHFETITADHSIANFPSFVGYTACAEALMCAEPDAELD